MEKKVDKVKGKVIFMTGGTSGLGKAAVCELADQGAIVFVAVRNDRKGKQLLDHYNTKYTDKKGRIELVNGDLSELSSVRSMCKELRKKTDYLDIIINNAGIFNFKFIESTDHIEETLQVNLLAPMLISHLLIDLLENSDDPKVIFTASALHQGTIRFEDMEFRKSYSAFNSYRQSKLGIILMTRLLAQNLSNKGIQVYAQHPGFVNSNLGDNSGFIAKLVFRLFGKSPMEGARNLLFLCECSSDQLKSGEYYVAERVKTITKESYDLDLASALKERVKIYLSSFIKEESIIF
jgi:NAD(P)-dependent dehydrogenase (short-subunit alcohol dehydrogenase family)